MKYFFIAALLLSTQISAKNDKLVDKHSCYGIDSKIEKVREKQRAGYKAKEGEKLIAELRELKELKSACIKNKIPTQ
jgi:hypothetical protein